MFFRASANTMPYCTAEPVTLFADCTRDNPLSKVSNCWVARKRACAAAEESKPCRPGVCPGFMVKGRVVSPVQKMVLPLIERMGGNCAELLRLLCTLSATFPAQPALGVPTSCALCHWSCWSECE